MPGMTLTKIQNEMYKSLGMDQNDLSLSDVNDLINRSYLEMYKKLNFREVQMETTISIVQGNGRIPISSLAANFDAVQHVTILDPDTGSNPNQEWHPVKFVDYSLMSDGYETATDTQAMPYQYARDKGDMILFPNADKGYSLRVRYRGSLADLASGTDVPVIPPEWHEVILYGALGRAWLTMGNPTRSNMFFTLQGSLVSTGIDVQTKEDVDHAYSGMAIKRQRYP